MNYQQALRWIHSIPRMPDKPGLKRIRALLERLGNPQEELRCIHVAGTNGKGSTCAMLSSIYTHGGYRTGLYVSPFITDFRERMQVNGDWIPQERLTAGVERIVPLWQELEGAGLPPSEFEVVTALAFDYFRRENCDLVVLETGLGGRFDSTNAVSRPLASVLTPIGMDHMAILGNTLERIAAEKCGIIKEGGVTVTSSGQDPAALAVIMEHCAQNNNRLLSPGRPVIRSMDLTGTSFSYEGADYRISLLGEHQVENAATVLETVKAVSLTGLAVPSGAVSRGLAQAALPARLEVLRREPLILLDGAHNEAGARVLCRALALLGDRPIHALVGMMGDKDSEACLAHILPYCRTVTATAPPMPGAVPAQELARQAAVLCPRTAWRDSPKEALDLALSQTGKGEALLLFGSLYLAGTLRPLVRGSSGFDEKQ